MKDSASRRIIALAVALASVAGQSCSKGGSPTAPSLPSLPAALTPLGCSGTAIGGVEINVNVPSTVTVFGETFDIQQASGSAPFRIQRNVVPCDYELTAQLRPGNFAAVIGLTRTTDPRADTGGIEGSSIVIDQGGTASGQPCVLNVGTTAGSFRMRFKVVSSNGCRTNQP
jgi:hypothetical protein